jgi:hypothetical protein
MSYPIKNYTSLAIATVQNLITKNPALSIGLLWIAFVTGGTISLLGLLNPGPKIAQEKSVKPISKIKTLQETPEGFTRVEKKPNKQDENIPIWLYIVIPITCATGSLLIVRQVNLAKKSKLKVKTKKRKKTSAKVANNSALVIQESIPELHQNLLPTSTINNHVEVTILPPNLKQNPQQSLTELLDLRNSKNVQEFLVNPPQEQWIEEEIIPHNPPPPVSYSINTPKKLPPQLPKDNQS